MSVLLVWEPHLKSLAMVSVWRCLRWQLGVGDTSVSVSWIPRSWTSVTLARRPGCHPYSAAGCRWSNWLVKCFQGVLGIQQWEENICCWVKQLHDILSPPEDTRLSVWIQFIYVVSLRHQQLPFAVSACWDSFPMLTRENNFSLISLSLEEAPGEIVLAFSFWRFLLRLLTIANFLKESGEIDFLQKLIYGHLFWEDGLSHFPCLMLTAEIQW